MRKNLPLADVLKKRNITLRDTYFIEFLTYNSENINEELLKDNLISLLTRPNPTKILDCFGNQTEIFKDVTETTISLDKFELRIKNNLAKINNQHEQLGLYYIGKDILPKNSFIPTFGKLLVCTKNTYFSYLENNTNSIRDAAFLFYFISQNQIFSVSCGIQENDLENTKHNIGKWWFANFGGIHQGFSYLGEPNCMYSHGLKNGEYRSGLNTIREIKPGDELLTFRNNNFNLNKEDPLPILNFLKHCLHISPILLIIFFILGFFTQHDKT